MSYSDFAVDSIVEVHATFAETRILRNVRCLPDSAVPRL